MDGGEPQMMSKELQAQLGEQGAGGSVEQMQEAKQQQAAAEQQKAEIMNSILTTEALQRRARTAPRPLARRSPPLTAAARVRQWAPSRWSSRSARSRWK